MKLSHHRLTTNPGSDYLDTVAYPHLPGDQRACTSWSLCAEALLSPWDLQRDRH